MDDTNFIFVTTPDDPVVDDFYQEYCKAFVLPNERETLSGFRECLEFNDAAQHPDVHRRYGPFCEFIGIARRTAAQAPVAGANFICFPMPDLGVVTVQSNYVFSASGSRKQGLARALYEQIICVARSFAEAHGFAGTEPLILFGEQNDPFKMTFGEYRADTEASGIDQFDRIVIWGRIGARILDFPYVQPALSGDQDADDTLFLRVMMPEDTSEQGQETRRVDPRVIKEHLRRFFAVSVLKCRTVLEDDPNIAAQFLILDDAIVAGRTVAAIPTPPENVVAGWKAQVRLRSETAAPTLLIGTESGFRSVPEAAAMIGL